MRRPTTTMALRPPVLLVASVGVLMVLAGLPSAAEVDGWRFIDIERVAAMPRANLGLAGPVAMCAAAWASAIRLAPDMPTGSITASRAFTGRVLRFAMGFGWWVVAYLLGHLPLAVVAVRRVVGPFDMGHAALLVLDAVAVLMFFIAGGLALGLMFPHALTAVAALVVGGALSVVDDQLLGIGKTVAGPVIDRVTSIDRPESASTTWWRIAVFAFLAMMVMSAATGMRLVRRPVSTRPPVALLTAGAAGLSMLVAAVLATSPGPSPWRPASSPLCSMLGTVRVCTHPAKAPAMPGLHRTFQRLFDRIGGPPPDLDLIGDRAVVDRAPYTPTTWWVSVQPDASQVPDDIRLAVMTVSGEAKCSMNAPDRGPSTVSQAVSAWILEALDTPHGTQRDASSDELLTQLNAHSVARVTSWYLAHRTSIMGCEQADLDDLRGER